jgi:hypothetical protein
VYDNSTKLPLPSVAAAAVTKLLGTPSNSASISCNEARTALLDTNAAGSSNVREMEPSNEVIT